MSKAKVKALCPDASAERHRTNRREVYWLIRRRGQFMYIADGNTESEAWKKALVEIQKRMPTTDAVTCENFKCRVNGKCGCEKRR